MNLNIKTGYLTKDPQEVKGTEKKIAKLVLAVKEDYKDKNGDEVVQFFTIVCWNALAENCIKYLKKGSRIMVVGKDQNRSWEDEKGEKKYAHEIIATQIDFLSTPKKKEQDENNLPF